MVGWRDKSLKLYEITIVRMSYHMVPGADLGGLNVEDHDR